MKRHSIVIFILVLCFTTFNCCKKAIKTDPIFEGNWITPNGYYQSFITITHGGYGKYYTIGYNSINNSKNPYKGKCRIDWINKHLYIGVTKFKIHDLPHVYTDKPDSIVSFGTTYKKTGVVMTIENSFLHGKRKMDFYQVTK